MADSVSPSSLPKAGSLLAVLSVYSPRNAVILNGLASLAVHGGLQSPMMKRNRPVDVTALSLFFAFSAVMCAAAAAMIYSSGALQSSWRLVPAIATLGAQAVSWLSLVSIACCVAALGLWRISYWGFLAASVLLVMTLIAHFWRAVITADWARLSIILALGIVVAFYLRSREGLFAHHGH